MLRVGKDLLLKCDELVGCRQLERDGHRRDGVDVRPALLAGEHGAVNALGQFFACGEDARRARPAQRLVRGERDDVGIADRRGEHAGRDHARHVADVGHQVRAHAVGNLAEALPVRRVRVRRVTGDDHARLVLRGELGDLVIVQPLGLQIHRVGHDVIVLARAVDRAAVRQVAAVHQAHAHHRVAGLEQRLVHGVVGGRAGKRLDVDEDLFGARHARWQKARRSGGGPAPRPCWRTRRPCNSAGCPGGDSGSALAHSSESSPGSGPSVIGSG